VSVVITHRGSASKLRLLRARSLLAMTNDVPVQAANNGIMCGAPFGRTVASQTSPAGQPPLDLGPGEWLATASLTRRVSSLAFARHRFAGRHLCHDPTIATTLLRSLNSTDIPAKSVRGNEQSCMSVLMAVLCKTC
jgi:hypothetical protein